MSFSIGYAIWDEARETDRLDDTRGRAYVADQRRQKNGLRTALGIKGGGAMDAEIYLQINLIPIIALVLMRLNTEHTLTYSWRSRALRFMMVLLTGVLYESGRQVSRWAAVCRGARFSVLLDPRKPLSGAAGIYGIYLVSVYVGCSK